MRFNFTDVESSPAHFQYLARNINHQTQQGGTPIAYINSYTNSTIHDATLVKTASSSVDHAIKYSAPSVLQGFLRGEVDLPREGDEDLLLREGEFDLARPGEVTCHATEILPESEIYRGMEIDYEKETHAL